MKKIFRISIIILLVILLYGCMKKNRYSDSVTCSEVLDTVEEQIPIDMGYESFGGDHIKYYFDGTEADDDHALRYSVLSEDINEIGIFHAPDKDSAEELYRLCRKYISETLEDKRTFIESYAPKEIKKLESAEVHIFGNYVAYAILSDNDRELFFDTVEKMLKNK